MAEAYVGEVRAFGFNFNPKDWMSCNGQLLPISQYTALFSILGTSFGGNGTTNFALPNLQSDVVVGAGTSALPPNTHYAVGQTGGESSVLLDSNTMATHNHAFSAASGRFKASSNAPGPAMSFAPTANCTPYVEGTPTPTVNAMALTAITPSGSASAAVHNNLAPSTAVNFCICINGTFPIRG